MVNDGAHHWYGSSPESQKYFPATKTFKLTGDKTRKPHQQTPYESASRGGERPSRQASHLRSSSGESKRTRSEISRHDGQEEVAQVRVREVKTPSATSVTFLSWFCSANLLRSARRGVSLPMGLLSRRSSSDWC